VSLEYAGAQRVVRATHEVSFDVYRGDRFVLLGPSGCGKSTLLKAVGGFIAPRAGGHAAGRPAVAGRARTASSCSRNSTSCRRGRR
jgi:NitT/TauT family transport system ATP-binding protein